MIKSKSQKHVKKKVHDGDTKIRVTADRSSETMRGKEDVVALPKN